jgi:hypothetical protein
MIRRQNNLSAGDLLDKLAESTVWKRSPLREAIEIA